MKAVATAQCPSMCNVKGHITSNLLRHNLRMYYNMRKFMESYVAIPKIPMKRVL